MYDIFLHLLWVINVPKVIRIYHFFHVYVIKSSTSNVFTTIKSKSKDWLARRRVWRYQRGNQTPYIEEEQTTFWIQKINVTLFADTGCPSQKNNCWTMKWSGNYFFFQTRKNKQQKAVNRIPAASHWPILSHKVVSNTIRHERDLNSQL
jgi:hypothetical protein